MPAALSVPFNVDDIEKIIYYWLDLLANEDYEEAFNLTVHDPYYSWTPASIENYIKGYGLPYEEGEPPYKVTNWRTAYKESLKCSIDFLLFENPISHDNSQFNVVGEIHCDLPLNGELSDLTAIFKILENKNYITLELNDIHVL